MDQPPILPYAPPPPRRGWAQFVVGILAGIIITLLVSVFMVVIVSVSNEVLVPVVLVLVPAPAIVGGIILATKPRWRPFGIGMAISVPLAVLTLGGICFAIVRH